jgi:hypothetical protein
VHAAPALRLLPVTSATGMAWETIPIPPPRIGQMGQKYQVFVVKAIAAQMLIANNVIAR